MALHEYECPECGIVEVNIPAGQATEDWQCPECGSVMKKIWGSVPDIWKCSGAARKKK